MKKTKKSKYTDKSLGEIKIIKDFLPPPEKLVLSNKQSDIIRNIKK